MTDRLSREPLPAESTKRDLGTAAAKGLLSAIPFAGGAAAELFGLLSIPLVHRRDAWFQDLAVRLGELEGRIGSFRLDTLAGNEQFVSAALQATQAALRTHQKEKLEALRNAVLNSAVGNKYEHDYQTVFLALIDRFSPAHLRLLKSFSKPRLTRDTIEYLRWALKVSGPGRANQLPRWVREYSPGFKRIPDQLILVLLSDLHNAGLIIRAEKGTFEDLPEGQKWTTAFGDQFLKFIESP